MEGNYSFEAQPGYEDDENEVAARLEEDDGIDMEMGVGSSIEIEDISDA